MGFFVRAWLSIALFLLVTAVRAEPVKVAVAANFSSTFQLLATNYEASTGQSVEISVGSSGKLYAQITQGAPFDIFLSADQQKPAALVAAGLATRNSIFTYAEGILVLWSAASPTHMKYDDSVTKVGNKLRERLLSGDYRYLALANPRLAPYGQAAMEVLASLGLEDNRRRQVFGENIAQSFQYVATGNADLGFVALSHWHNYSAGSKSSYWLIPEGLYRPIKQDAVLLERAAESPAAQALLAFLRSEEARALIASQGYR